MRTTRRWTIGLLAATGLATAGHALGRHFWPATPGSTAGPFYPQPEMRLDDVDADLTRRRDGSAAQGTPLLLEGRLRSHRGGDPIGGALVEIWQVDANGRYLHPGDRRGKPPRDDAFQGYGRARTQRDGAFAFQTIEPVPYPGRTPHIHMRISTLGGLGLTTQLYLDSHPLNDRDGIYQRMTRAERKLVGLIPLADDDGLGTTAQVDIVL
ncbi:MAG: protocatechuate 3,4-dioxygenase [Pseudomonadota bacterium]